MKRYFKVKVLYLYYLLSWNYLSWGLKPGELQLLLYINYESKLANHLSADLSWCLLISVDLYKHLLTSVDLYWYPLMSVDIYRNLLISIDVHWHLLTSIDIDRHSYYVANFLYFPLFGPCLVTNLYHLSISRDLVFYLKSHII